MLKGKELGAAFRKALELKLAANKKLTKKRIASEFGIQPPSLYDWMDRGTIDKEHFSTLWKFFSDVVPASHWGITAEDLEVLNASTPKAAEPPPPTYIVHQTTHLPPAESLLLDGYRCASPEVREAMDGLAAGAIKLFKTRSG